MDSVTQIALGAAVGVAVMGRRTAPWKAALWGGVVGTLPDLDAFVDYGDAVRNMTLHRAESHSLFWQTIASPFIAAVIAAIDRRRGGFTGAFPRWWLAVWLVLITHALLDGMTVYGTQLALPFSNHPFGVGSIFIIDPLYTLPLLAGLVATLVAYSRSRWRWNRLGLLLSTAYLGWTMAAQAYVTDVVQQQLAGGADRAGHVLVTPTAFNSLLWRVVVMHPDGYDEGFYSLLDGDRGVRFDRFERDAALYTEVSMLPAVSRVAWFSKGFFRVRERDGRVTITDLRMGQEPFYVFSFEVARRASPPAAVTPTNVGGREGIDFGRVFGWLGRRMLGADLPPPR